MGLSVITKHARDAISGAYGYAIGSSAPTIRLGVTGLSHAGKTVFITALVDNLLNRGRLPFFEPLIQGRIQAVYLEPQPDDDVPRFDYERHRAALRAEAPDWPQSTRQISQLRLTFEYQPQGFWSKVRGRITGRRTLHLDIVDYPGEWLLDLPLLDMDFYDWSRETLALSRAPLRAHHAGAWHKFLAKLDPAAAQDEEIAKQGARLFTDYLAACRGQSHVLSTLPPGRFLMPGELAGSPALTFMPLDISEASVAAAGSLHAMMARRFEAYKSKVVKPFYQNHFARLDRQIVLVDALAALNAGPSSVADLERALEGVLASFKTGANGWLSTILGKRIDRILFAATKADHLHETSHDRLKAILDVLTEKARGRADFAGAETKVEAIASVRATRQGTAREGGEDLPCIIGIPQAGERIGTTAFHGNREAAVFPGDLPQDPEQALYAQADSLPPMRFVRFRPPETDDNAAPLPHIRLDRVLQFLLGDRFP